jgi:hypothetical protein
MTIFRQRLAKALKKRRTDKHNHSISLGGSFQAIEDEDDDNSSDSDYEMEVEDDDEEDTCQKNSRRHKNIHVKGADRYMKWLKRAGFYNYLRRSVGRLRSTCKASVAQQTLQKMGCFLSWVNQQRFQFATVDDVHVIKLLKSVYRSPTVLDGWLDNLSMDRVSSTTIIHICEYLKKGLQWAAIQLKALKHMSYSHVKVHINDVIGQVRYTIMCFTLCYRRHFA